jgi:hypothetical protein
MSLDPTKTQGASAAVDSLVQQGIPRTQAVSLVQKAIARMWAEKNASRSGLGDTADAVLTDLKNAGEAAPIKAVRDAITPWLFVFSIVGFGMGLMNTRRISLMFSNWKKKRRMA